MKYFIFAVGLVIACASPTHAFSQGRFKPVFKAAEYVGKAISKNKESLSNLAKTMRFAGKIEKFHKDEMKMKQQNKVCLYNLWAEPKPTVKIKRL